jgi:hypothetical protein
VPLQGVLSCSSFQLLWPTAQESMAILKHFDLEEEDSFHFY